MPEEPPHSAPDSTLGSGRERASRRLGAGLATSIAVLSLLLWTMPHAVADGGEVGDGSDPLHRDAASAGASKAIIGGTTRVVGGTLSARGRWPSVVALVRDGFASPADRQFCGGTVLASRWVLTAAHCLYDSLDLQIRPSTMRVIEGVSDLRAESPDEEVVVSNLYVHPAYDHASENAYHDIALLELATELSSPPVLVFRDDPETLGTRPGTIVGWGATDFVTPRLATYPDALHEAELPLVTREVCNDPMSYAGNIREGQLCAGFPEGGIDSCIGDSGGPLFVNTGERVEQVGVVSFGRGCAEPLFYGIYTSIATYIDWIGDYTALPDAPRTEQPRGPTPVEASPPVEASGSSGGGGSAAGGSLLLLALLAVRRRAMSLAAVSCGALVTLGCAHGAVLVAYDDGGQRVELAGQPLGASRASVLADSTRLAGTAPRCTFSKLAPARMRKAFPLERCEYALDARGAGAMPLDAGTGTMLGVERLVVWFVDDRLVRADARLSPSAVGEPATTAVQARAGDAATARTRLDERFGPADAEGRWRVGADVVALALDADGAARVVALDGAVLSRLPALVDPVRARP